MVNFFIQKELLPPWTFRNGGGGLHRHIEVLRRTKFHFLEETVQILPADTSLIKIADIVRIRLVNPSICQQTFPLYLMD